MENSIPKDPSDWTTQPPKSWWWYVTVNGYLPLVILALIFGVVIAFADGATTPIILSVWAFLALIIFIIVYLGFYKAYKDYVNTVNKARNGK